MVNCPFSQKLWQDMPFYKDENWHGFPHEQYHLTHHPRVFKPPLLFALRVLSCQQNPSGVICLVVKALDSQSRGPMLKTRWMAARLST